VLMNPDTRFRKPLACSSLWFLYYLEGFTGLISELP
jgi:hypothetical protein